jgi:hypothetical protein
MSLETEEFLAHYGIVGMKWGKRKARDDEGSKNPKSAKQPSASPKSELTGREARRKAKSDKILAKADDVQKQIDDLKKNGTNSDYMRKKYGDAMGIDSRSADMSVQLRHKHSKKELLAAEIKGLEASKAHFKADAQLAAQGKLTQKEKMLIGAGVATVILAAGITYAVIADKNQKQRVADALREKDRLADASFVKREMSIAKANQAKRAAALAEAKLEKERFESIKPGDRISMNDYWKKMETTEVSRLSGISKDAFDKMDETPITVPAGHIFKRVSTNQEEKLRDRIYVTFKDEDHTRYQAALPKFWNLWGIGTEATGGYVVSVKAKEAIVSPSQKERVKTFIDLMDENVSYESSSGETKIVKAREWLGGKSYQTNEEVALSAYRSFSMGLVNKTPISDAYFDKLKSKGFNAIIDDNDSGKLSDSPMLIFDTGQSMERIGATRLTAENIAEARDKLVELTKRT